MNTRPHSEKCLNGEPCRRCYIRLWDKVRRDRKRKRRFAPRERTRKELPKDWVDQQRSKGHENHLKYYPAHGDRIRATNRRWHKENPRRSSAITAKYRASKLNATPAWADLEKIAAIYAECPPGMEVDHIVPLQGENVCGLHVHYNLQYLSVSENRSKSNRWN